MRALIPALIAVLILLTGCTRKIYVPVEDTVTRTDTVYSAKFRVDSVIFRDSITVMTKGDTVFLTKYRDRFRVRLITDTVYKTRYDSVTVSKPYPVERKLTRWEKARQDLGVISICVIVILIVFLLLIYRFDRRAK